MILYCRHGITDANKNDLVCGQRWDIELNEDGKSMALSLGQEIRSRFPDFSGHIVSSPLIRAQQTAYMISIALKDVPVIVEQNLAEWDMGDWERRPFQEIEVCYNSGENPPNGESKTIFSTRVKSTYLNLLERYQNLIIVGHGEFWIELSKLVLEKPSEIKNGHFKILPNVF